MFLHILAKMYPNQNLSYVEIRLLIMMVLKGIQPNLIKANSLNLHWEFGAMIRGLGPSLELEIYSKNFFWKNSY